MQRVLVAEDDREILSLVSSSLAFRGYEVIPTRNGAEAWEVIRTEQPEGVILDMELPGLSGLEVCKRLRADPNARGSRVILLSARGAAESRLAAAEAGADDLVVKPFAPRDLTVRLDALLNPGGAPPMPTRMAPAGRPGAAPKSRLIALFGGKGGVGTAALSVNLGVALAMTGAPTCLVDLDLERPVDEMLLDLVPAREGTIASLAAGYGPEETDWDLLQGLLLPHSSGLRLLPGPQSPVQAESVTGKHIRAYISLLLARHTYLVIDLVAGYRETVLDVLEGADRVLVVITPDLAAMKGARALASILEQLKIPLDKLGLVINHTTPSSGISPNDIKRALALPILANIPYGGDEFLNAYNGGKPIVQKRPQHATSAAIRKLSESLAPALKG